ncbi:hypothetical protein ACWEBX_03335 [Streptomyces sp. NPDC005070]
MDNDRRTPAQPLSDDDAAREARRILAAWKPDEPAAETVPTTTSYRDETDVPETGDAEPVLQPETRRVPAWAAGIAVASLGIGAGTTGLGCAAWLAFKGLALVSVPSLQSLALALLAPFAGVALAAVAIGAAISKAKRSGTTNVYKGPVTVTNKAEVNSTARGAFARNRNDIRPS